MRRRTNSQLALVGMSSDQVDRFTSTARARRITLIPVHEDAVLFTELGCFQAVVVAADGLRHPAETLAGLFERLVPVVLVTANGERPTGEDYDPRSLGVTVLSHGDLQRTPADVLGLIQSAVWE